MFRQHEYRYVHRATYEEGWGGGGEKTRGRKGGPGGMTGGPGGRAGGMKGGAGGMKGAWSLRQAAYFCMKQQWFSITKACDCSIISKCWQEQQ